MGRPTFEEPRLFWRLALAARCQAGRRDGARFLLFGAAYFLGALAADRPGWFLFLGGVGALCLARSRELLVSDPP